MSWNKNFSLLEICCVRCYQLVNDVLNDERSSSPNLRKTIPEHQTAIEPAIFWWPVSRKYSKVCLETETWGLFKAGIKHFEHLY